MPEAHSFKKVVVAIYPDADFYPPTLNMVLNLAQVTDTVTLLSRKNSEADFPFPGNVQWIRTGTLKTVRESEQQGTLQKVQDFIGYTKQLWQLLKNGTCDLLLLYDPIPLFAWFLIRPYCSKNMKVWYHNHDMPDLKQLRKFSIGWFAARKEHQAMKYVHYFSLPSEDRKPFYPQWPASKPICIIPNYPSALLYKNPVPAKKSEDEVRLIYQGFIGRGHALHDIIRLLPESFEGRSLKLILKGPVGDSLKHELESLAQELGVDHQVTWLGIGPYADLPAITASCDIGIGIRMQTDAVSQTLGTASNKIYEYAAVGLPVMVYNSPQFRKYLSGYPWVHFTDGTMDSLRICITGIIKKLPEESQMARASFLDSLHFEPGFQKAWHTWLNHAH